MLLYAFFRTLENEGLAVRVRDQMRVRVAFSARRDWSVPHVRETLADELDRGLQATGVMAYRGTFRDAVARWHDRRGARVDLDDTVNGAASVLSLSACLGGPSSFFHRNKLHGVDQHVAVGVRVRGFDGLLGAGFEAESADRLGLSKCRSFPPGPERQLAADLCPCRRRDGIRRRQTAR